MFGNDVQRQTFITNFFFLKRPCAARQFVAMIGGKRNGLALCGFYLELVSFDSGQFGDTFVTERWNAVVYSLAGRRRLLKVKSAS